MIRIHQNNSHVVVTIEITTTTKKEMQFSINCDDALYAELLTRKMHEDLSNRIEEIRKEEYQEGWKDAKAKRLKRNWFGSTMRLIFSTK